LYDRAIEIQERLVHAEGRLELAEDLATAYSNKALAEAAAGNDQVAERLRRQANEMRARLAQREDQGGPAEPATRGSANTPHGLRDPKDQRSAGNAHDWAMETGERSAQMDSSEERARHLAQSRPNNARAARLLAEMRAAAEQCRRTNDSDPLRSFKLDLAHYRALGYRRTAMDERFRDEPAAVELCTRAIEIWEYLVYHEGWRELAGNLAEARGIRGLALIDHGETEKGSEEVRAAVKQLGEEIARTGRADLERFLQWITNEFNKAQASIV